MNLRLKTNLNVERKLNELQGLLQVSSRAAVMRLAIAFSIKEGTDPTIVDGVHISYDVRKQDGVDYNRFTIYGDDEIYFKIQMEQSLCRYLEDDQFFPEMTNAHITRGIEDLYSELKLAGSKEKFLKKFVR